MEDEAHRATRSKAEYQRRLKMVAQLLSDGKVSEVRQLFRLQPAGAWRVLSYHDAMAAGDTAHLACALTNLLHMPLPGLQADFDGAAAEEAARQDAAMLTRGQSRKALSTNNPEKFDEKSVVR